MFPILFHVPIESYTVRLCNSQEEKQKTPPNKRLSKGGKPKTTPKETRETPEKPDLPKSKAKPSPKPKATVESKAKVKAKAKSKTTGKGTNGDKEDTTKDDKQNPDEEVPAKKKHKVEIDVDAKTSDGLTSSFFVPSSPQTRDFQKLQG